MYKYRLVRTGYSSNKYGPCEVCGKHAPEVYHQIESKYFKFVHNEAVYEGWTSYGCHNLFGHKECLISQRRRDDE